MRVGYAFDELSGRVIEAAIAVHKRLGPGFLESVYEQALRLELAKRSVPFESQKAIKIAYDGTVVGNHVLDLLVGGKLVVELKAIERFEDVHFAQVKSYLRASGTKVGLLMNFNSTQLVVKRVVLGFREKDSVDRD